MKRTKSVIVKAAEPKKAEPKKEKKKEAAPAPDPPKNPNIINSGAGVR